MSVELNKTINVMSAPGRNVEGRIHHSDIVKSYKGIPVGECYVCERLVLPFFRILVIGVDDLLIINNGQKVDWSAWDEVRWFGAEVLAEVVCNRSEEVGPGAGIMSV
jgi:hypothetical protein